MTEVFRSAVNKFEKYLYIKQIAPINHKFVDYCVWGNYDLIILIVNLSINYVTRVFNC